MMRRRTKEVPPKLDGDGSTTLSDASSEGYEEVLTRTTRNRGLYQYKVKRGGRGDCVPHEEISGTDEEQLSSRRMRSTRCRTRLKKIGKHNETRRNSSDSDAFLREKTKRRKSGDIFSYVCSFCDKNFRSENAYSTHMDIVHYRFKRFSCEKCKKRYPTKRQLELHAMKSHEQTLYSCQTCGLRYKNKKDLDIHSPIHRGERPYVCGWCQVGFNLIHHLSQHMLLHTGVRSYLCTTCGMRFKQNSNFHRHVRTHQDNRNWKCDQCDASFNENSGLLRHKLTHTNLKPHACRKCGKGFRRRDQLRQHIYSTHR